LLLDACDLSVSAPNFWVVINTHLVEVDVHALELEVGSSIVDTVSVETVLAGDVLPEGGTNLVTLSIVSNAKT
jgi:hypothetical protein